MRERGSSRCRGPTLALLVGPGLLLPRGASLSAQEDFRSADLDRPILVEDAYPIKLREWEFEAGVRGSVAEEGSGATGSLELKAGLFLNTQVGVEAELAARDLEDGSAAGLEAAGAHLLYNFNRETWSWPAFAVRADVETPGTGGPGHEDWSGAFKGIATRSFDRLRLHANGGYAVQGRLDGGGFWLAGLGFDYPIGLFSKAVMGDLFVELPAGAGRTRVWLEAGSRWQLTNLSVLDFGLATRLDEWERGEANVELILGYSRIFAIPGLVRPPPYPEPRIR